MSTVLDIKSNRSKREYSNRELLSRICWGVGSIIFRFTPRNCFGIRRALLRTFGASVGPNVHIYNSAVIYYPWQLEIGSESAIGEDVLIYNLGLITIGCKTTISHRAHLCAGTHDHSDPTLPLLRPKIILGNQVWVCADAFVGPGVRVEDGAIIGARSAVFSDVDSWMIVGGNPARVIKRRVLSAATINSNDTSCN